MDTLSGLHSSLLVSSWPHDSHRPTLNRSWSCLSLRLFSLVVTPVRPSFNPSGLFILWLLPAPQPQSTLSYSLLHKTPFPWLTGPDLLHFPFSIQNQTAVYSPGARPRPGTGVTHYPQHPAKLCHPQHVTCSLEPCTCSRALFPAFSR